MSKAISRAAAIVHAAHFGHCVRAEGIKMFKTFPDNRVGNRRYKVFFADGDWTCSIARFTGTMIGPMNGPTEQ
jgi:hypothetical protein